MKTEVTFHKDEFGNYAVKQDGVYIGVVIDKLPNGMWEVYSTREADKDAPQIVKYRTLKECKDWCKDQWEYEF